MAARSLRVPSPFYLSCQEGAWEEEVDGFTREQSLDSAWCGGGAKQCCTELKIHH